MFLLSRARRVFTPRIICRMLTYNGKTFPSQEVRRARNTPVQRFLDENPVESIRTNEELRNYLARMPNLTPEEEEDLAVFEDEDYLEELRQEFGKK